MSIIEQVPLVNIYMNLTLLSIIDRTLSILPLSGVVPIFFDRVTRFLNFLFFIFYFLSSKRNHNNIFQTKITTKSIETSNPYKWMFGKKKQLILKIWHKWKRKAKNKNIDKVGSIKSSQKIWPIPADTSDKGLVGFQI